ncbi:interleukin-6 receptor subunit beta-like [Sceloporus undulatus]|uniref:interleukin-6 receptor subunit beta-like n=1 Tax=Sceloporus undulatus TaxID=8520 RepID=UPI001C4B6C5C|nr:interleukin-6 receptor subunit beta-like [Sceloporus undulatus]
MAFRMQLALGWIVTLLVPASCSVTPRVPKIEYCVTFWGGNITCYWDLLPETHPPMTYTLHVTEESGHCRRDFGAPAECVAKPEERWCSIPIENLFAFYKIKLTAENQQVRLSSLEKCIHGMNIVKLSPPVIRAILANQSRCFQMEWDLPGDEILSASEAQYEIHYRDLAETSWTQVNFTVVENAAAFANICGVSPFTNYSVRVRAKYLHSSSLQSNEGPVWSEWSAERFVRTLPAVPSRGPALWRKLGAPDAYGKRSVVLMWKPLKPTEANGEILAYRLRSQRKGEPAILQCLTKDLQCTLFLPAQVGYTFFIAASNAVGVSPSSKIVVPPSGGQEDPSSPLPVLASPVGEKGLLIQWSLPSFPQMHYILEWGRLPEKEGANIFWRHQPGNVNHMVINEAIEPGHLYNLKLFALIDGTIWASGSTSSYSKQIAPLRAPSLYPVQIWKSQVKLLWEKLPLEDRGGVIRNYSICYKEDGRDEQTVVVEGSVQSYLIKGLRPGSMIRVSIAASTEGGSTRGPALSIRMKSNGHGEAETLLSVLCVGFLLLLLFVAGSLTCIWKHRWVQKYLWPQIPDPAKSNLATWMPPKMCLDPSSRCTETWSQGYLTLTIGDLLGVHTSQQEGSDPRKFLGDQWLLQVPSTFQKTISINGKRGTLWEDGEGPPKSTAANEVDYSKVVVVHNSRGLQESWRSPHHSHSFSKAPDPQNVYSRTLFGQSVWLQNLTYEVVVQNRALKSTGEFPLLGSLMAMERDLHPAEIPCRDNLQNS